VTIADLDGLGPLPATKAACAELGLCATRSSAPGARICREDLDSHDLVVCVDDEVRTAILRWLADDLSEDELAYYEQGRVCLLSDFCSIELEADRTQQTSVIDPTLRARVAPLRGILEGGLASTRAWPEPGSAALTLGADGAARLAADGSWRLAEASFVLGCAGLTRFAKDTIDAGFLVAYDTLLGEMFCRREHLAATWTDAEPRIRAHVFTGALTGAEREHRFHEHIARLAAQLNSA